MLASYNKNKTVESYEESKLAGSLSGGSYAI